MVKMEEKKKRGRPKKSIKEKKEEVVRIKEVEEIVVANKAKIKALVRLSHKSKTYEVGEVFEEEDPEMVDQIVKKGFGEVV